MISLPHSRFRECTKVLRGPYEHFFCWPSAVAVDPLITALFFAKGVGNQEATFTREEHKVFQELENLTLKVDFLSNKPKKTGEPTQILDLLEKAKGLCGSLTKLLQTRDALALRLKPLELERHLSLEREQWDSVPLHSSRGSEKTVGRSSH